MSDIAIKSYSGGIKLIISEEIDFEALVDQVRIKFTDSAKFFKGSKLSLIFEGITLTDLQERVLVNEIERCGELSILYVLENDVNTGTTYTKSYDSAFSYGIENAYNANVFRGTIKKDEVQQFDSSVLIIGDVEPGAIIKAAGDIIILGGLYGSAFAGTENDTKRFIFASEMSCEKMMIGPFCYYSKEKAKWSIRPKYQNKIAYIKDNSFIIENATRELLNKL